MRVDDMKNNEQLVGTFWWQKPSKATDRDEHRVVSVIELFCDLVFVAYIGSVSHGLINEADIYGIIKFILLFTIGWIVWLNSAQYHDIHGNDDFKTRLLTFVQMVLVGLMAVFSHDVLHHTYMYFVVSLAGIVIVLGLMWRGTGIADPEHLVYSKPYSRTYFLLASGLIISCLLPESYRLYYLVITVVVLIMPMIANYLLGDKTIRNDYVKRLKVSHSFIERSNLFFIIVLGEVIIGALNGFNVEEFTRGDVALLFFNFLIAFGFWFNHFEFVGYIEHRENISGYFMWLLSFFLETISVTFIGSVVYLEYGHFDIAYLIISTILFFLATIIHFTFNKKINNPNICIDTKFALIFMSISMVLLGVVLVLSVFNIIQSNVVKAIFYIIILYIPVISGLSLWVRGSKNRKLQSEKRKDNE